MKTSRHLNLSVARTIALVCITLLASFITGRWNGGMSLAAPTAPAGGQDAPTATCPDAQCFADVPADNPFFAFANRLYQQDVVTGYPCGGPGEPCDAQNRPYYRPGNTVTRQQMSKFVDQARNLPGIHIDTATDTQPLYSYSRADGGTGVYGESDSGSGVVGVTASITSSGVLGVNLGGAGVYGQSLGGRGVIGESLGGYGVAGVYGYGGSEGYGVHGYGETTWAAVLGQSVGTDGTGAAGIANTGYNARGVWGHSDQGIGVYGDSDGPSAGVYGRGRRGVEGRSEAENGDGVLGVADNGAAAYGVSGVSLTGFGVSGQAYGAGTAGVVGTSDGGYGIWGTSLTTYAAIFGDGFTTDGTGVAGRANGGANAKGVYGISNSGWAGYFEGNVRVTGACTGCLHAAEYDHPLDPEHKYLYHAAVESPDMMNVYNGNVTLDTNGEAVIAMPDYFEAFNKDFRYQLTAIGAPGPNLYVAEEIQENRFKIAGGMPNSKVSWQVTGIRHDPYSEQRRVQVEVEKPTDEQGLYVHPEAYGQPDSKGIGYEDQQRLEQTQPPSAKKLPESSKR